MFNLCHLTTDMSGNLHLVAYGVAICKRCLLLEYEFFFYLGMLLEYELVVNDNLNIFIATEYSVVNDNLKDLEQ